MSKDDLRDLFAQFPRHGARSGFSARVRERIQREMKKKRRARFRLTPVLAPSAAGLILVALVAWWVAGFHAFPAARDSVSAVGDSARQQQARQRLKDLRSERDLLEKQVARVRTLLAEASPVVYLGGTDSFDLVLDLSKTQPRVENAQARSSGPPLQN